MEDLVTLQNIANVLDTPIFVRSVPVLQYMKSLSFMLSLARHEGVGGARNDNRPHRQHSRILAILLSSLGWQTSMPQEYQWKPYQFLRKFSEAIDNLELLTLNQIVGSAHRSLRSRSLWDSDSGPSDPNPDNQNVLVFQHYNHNPHTTWNDLPVAEVGQINLISRMSISESNEFII